MAFGLFGRFVIIFNLLECPLWVEALALIFTTAVSVEEASAGITIFSAVKEDDGRLLFEVQASADIFGVIGEFIGPSAGLENAWKCNIFIVGR